MFRTDPKNITRSIPSGNKIVRSKECGVQMKSAPESCRVDLRNANAMKKERIVRSHRLASLAHLTALDALGAAFAALFTNKATAEGGQAVKKKSKSVKYQCDILDLNSPGTEAALAAATLALRLGRRSLILGGPTLGCITLRRILLRRISLLVTLGRVALRGVAVSNMNINIGNFGVDSSTT